MGKSVFFIHFSFCLQPPLWVPQFPIERKMLTGKQQKTQSSLFVAYEPISNFPAAGPS